MERLRENSQPAGVRFLSLLVLPLLLIFASPAEARAQYTSDSGDLRLEVNQSTRELYVYLGSERVASHPVAIGQPDHPTPTGEFGIHQVDWNPDWTPPDSDWAEGADYTPPGHPDNPMGRARLIYRAPYSIHGTDVLESLGEAASHGSIRVANEVAKELARLIMEHGDAARSESWYEEAIANPTEMREVSIPNPVPLIIY